MPKSNYQNDFNGILLINKPQAWTSHDVVAKIRNHFKLKKVGHGGTLDPMATGLLILLIGRSTKLSTKITESDKVYDGTILLGQTTNTQDTMGKIIDSNKIDNISLSKINSVITNNFIGEIKQVPPMVSAIKKNGVPLYKLARKGINIKREPRTIHIHDFSVISFKAPYINFYIKCSKGTYVRTIANDLGKKLETGGCLSSLRRTNSGFFKLDNAYELDDILDKDPELLENLLIDFESKK